MIESDSTGTLSLALSDTDLQDLQQKAVEYLYDIESSHSSFFALVNFSSMTSTGESYSLMNTAFRVQSVSFQDYFSFEFEVDKVLRTPMLTSVTRPDNVKITFIEDVYRSISKYHKDWMLKWYNPSCDVVRIGPLGKLRGCDIILYHYINENPEDPLDPKVKVEPVMAYYLRGLAPKKLSEVTLSMSENKVIETVDVEYVMSRLYSRYNPKYQEKLEGFLKEDNDKDENGNSKKSLQAGIWTPDPLITSNTSKKFSYEGPRIARSIYSNLVGEGEV